MKKTFKMLGVLIITLIVTSAIYILYVNTQITVKDQGVVETPYSRYIGIKKTNVAMKDYSTVMKDGFTRVGKEVENNSSYGGEFGKAFSIYQKSSEGKDYDLTMAFEYIGGEIYLMDNNVVLGNRPSIHARAFEVTGSYSHFTYAWFYSMLKTTLVDGDKIDENSISYEVYEIGIMDTENPKEYKTIIYIPIK